LTHVALVFDDTNAGNVANWTELQKAADATGMVAVPIRLRSLDDLQPSVEEAVRDGVGAVFTTPPGRIPAAGAYARLADLALRHHLPSMGFERRFAEAGGLMSEGPNMLAIYRRAGYYVDRILKGARPGDLHVEQPREFELVVNQTTAHALGLTIPPDVAAQVTEWVK
jgi:putative ABC transport system substrate-binding protein